MLGTPHVSFLQLLNFVRKLAPSYGVSGITRQNSETWLLAFKSGTPKGWLWFVGCTPHLPSLDDTLWARTTASHINVCHQVFPPYMVKLHGFLACLCGANQVAWSANCQQYCQGNKSHLQRRLNNRQSKGSTWFRNQGWSDYKGILV